MITKIQYTPTYKKMDKVAQNIVCRYKSQVQISDAVVQARNLGVEQWEKQTNLPTKWRQIVIEILEQ